jgi:outer membrane protein OmpA-like peptidoglycan-associated protein
MRTTRYHQGIPALGALIVAALVTGGCTLATKKYVDQSEARTEERVNDLATQVEESQTLIEEQGETLEVHEKRLDEMSDTSREALARAITAGKLAEGKLLYETVLTDDQIQFGVSDSRLGSQASEALSELAAALTAENAGVFLEIQGHTDSTGSSEYNLQLGERRAMAVRSFLNGSYDIPLHRMAVISYGEERPIADNSTAAGRAQNRRVTIVVLR